MGIEDNCPHKLNFYFDIKMFNEVGSTLIQTLVFVKFELNSFRLNHLVDTWINLLCTPTFNLVSLHS